MALAATSDAASAKTGCPHANALPREAKTPQLRNATLCLINKARARKGLAPLTANLHLQRMASRHSKVMVAKDCFRHKCSGEDRLAKRIQTSGYVAGAKKWSFAEDLGFESTPRQMVARFLKKRFDRRNVLNPKFMNVGIGLRRGAPDRRVHDSKFVTYTLDLAWRKPPV